VTYRVTTSKDPPRKEPNCSRHGGSTWRQPIRVLIKQYQILRNVRWQHDSQ
jgi:hypothetical protein